MEHNGNLEEKMFQQGIPEPTLKRLPLYYQFVKNLHTQGIERVSCPDIAKELGLNPIQVKKDIAVTGIVGKPKTGYSVERLKEAIEHFFGWNNTTDAFLVGCGNLGKALLRFKGFEQYRLNIVAAFDNSPDKIGKEVYGRKIFSINKLPDLCRRMNVIIGIITVPEEFAQDTSDIMVGAGIRGIWNFASRKLKVPQHVVVQREDLCSSLSILSKKVKINL